MIIDDSLKYKVLKNNILSIAQEAKSAKDDNPNIINATIGMLADEDNKFYTFKAVKEAMKNISDYDAFSYSDTNGGQLFTQAVLSWVFGDTLDSFKENFYIKTIATPGGSGAIASLFTNYLLPNEVALIPNYMWETYITFVKERNALYSTYSLYNEEFMFNIVSLKEEIDKIKDNQKRIVLVINDPCHNPTGFCMSDRDYDALIELLLSYKNNDFVLIMDIAYFDFYNPNGNIIRKRYQKLTKLTSNFLINFAFSGSKTFGLYGLRIGMSIGLSKNEEEIKQFYNVVEYTARNNWGSSSKLGISIINNLLLNEEYLSMFKEEIKNVSKMLINRSKAFLEEAKKENLELLHFECGFFVCVPTNDSISLMNKLKTKGIYVVPLKSCIRIALCAISIDEAKRLPKIIKEVIEEGK